MDRRVKPPCVAVIFTSKRLPGNDAEYARAAEEMERLARDQPGFIHVESVRGADGVGITISYWESMEAAHAWGKVPAHQSAQKLGREKFYQWFDLRVAEIRTSRSFTSNE
jgi:heme-degrading monooxygenase HmoA